MTTENIPSSTKPDTFRIIVQQRKYECKCTMIDCSGWGYDYTECRYFKKINDERWERIDYNIFNQYCNRHTNYTKEIIKSTGNREEFDVDFEEITEYKVIPEPTEEIIEEIKFDPSQDKYLEYSLPDNLSTYRNNKQYNSTKRPQKQQYGTYKHHRYHLRHRPY